MKIARRLIWTFLGTTWILGSAMAGALAGPSPDSDLPDTSLKREIHNAIVEDATLPYCAHVVVVRVEDGVVTLVGKVHSQDEAKALREKAATIAGPENVVADLRVF